MFSGASAEAGTLCVRETCFPFEELLLCCLDDCRGEVLISDLNLMRAATDGHCYQQRADVDLL